MPENLQSAARFQNCFQRFAVQFPKIGVRRFALGHGFGQDAHSLAIRADGDVSRLGPRPVAHIRYRADRFIAAGASLGWDAFAHWFQWLVAGESFYSNTVSNPQCGHFKTALPEVPSTSGTLS